MRKNFILFRFAIQLLMNNKKMITFTAHIMKIMKVMEPIPPVIFNIEPLDSLSNVTN